MVFKLGKKAALHDPRTVKLGAYIDESKLLPSIPSKCDWISKVPSYPMYDNDRIGNCGLAGPAHQVQVWTFNSNDSVRTTPSIEQVISEYSRYGNYDPSKTALDGSNPTDGGVVMLDVMNGWRRNGLFGYKIPGYGSINPQNHGQVAAGVHLFGGLIVGLSLPAAVNGQPMNEVWRAPSRFHAIGKWAPGSWGGHCVIVNYYDEQVVKCVTWGGIKDMSWNFFTTYCDEAYFALSSMWLGADGKAPNGFGGMDLMRDLRILHK